MPAISALVLFYLCFSFMLVSLETNTMCNEQSRCLETAINPGIIAHMKTDMSKKDSEEQRNDSENSKKMNKEKQNIKQSNREMMFRMSISKI